MDLSTNLEKYISVFFCKKISVKKLRSMYLICAQFLQCQGLKPGPHMQDKCSAATFPGPVYLYLKPDYLDSQTLLYMMQKR